MTSIDRTAATNGFLIALALLLGVSAGRQAREAWRSVVDYAPPCRFADSAAGGTPPLAERVLLIVVDGLRLDRSAELPFLNRLREQGASLSCLGAMPSYSRPGRANLATGAWSEIHGATTNFHDKPVAVDNLFRAASKAGRVVAIAGSRLWPSLFRHELGAAAVLQPAPRDGHESFHKDLEALRAFDDRAVALVLSRAPDLGVLDIVLPDAAAHEFGADSDEYGQATLEADRRIGELLQRLDLTTSVVAVTSDHGHRSRGGHGGGEPDVLETPLVLAGKGIRRGIRSSSRQVDVAPTLAALLGLPLPVSAQGLILFEVLDADAGARRALLEAQWRQKQAFASSCSAGRSGTTSNVDPPGDAGALETAAAEIEGQLDTLRHARLVAERNTRLPMAVFLLVVPVLALGLAARGRWRTAGPAAVFAAIAYEGFFRLLLGARGMELTISSIQHEDDLGPYLFWIAVFAFVAMALALMGVFLFLRRFDSGSTLPERWLTGFAALWAVFGALVVPVAATYFQQGLFMEWRAPDLDRAFSAFVSLVQLQSVAWTAPLPLAAWVFFRWAARVFGFRRAS